MSANAGIDYRPGGRRSAGLNATLQGGRTTSSSAELRDYNAAQCALDIYALWQIGARAKLRMSAANPAQRAPQRLLVQRHRRQHRRRASCSSKPSDLPFLPAGAVGATVFVVKPTHFRRTRDRFFTGFPYENHEYS